MAARPAFVMIRLIGRPPSSIRQTGISPFARTSRISFWPTKDWPSLSKAAGRNRSGFSAAPLAWAAAFESTLDCMSIAFGMVLLLRC
jgi:hypothetical protein